MSINSAMAAGASGLIANSSALAAISDNIANVNTVGYKRVDTIFTPNYKIGGGGETRSMRKKKRKSKSLLQNLLRLNREANLLKLHNHGSIAVFYRTSAIKVVIE